MIFFLLQSVDDALRVISTDNATVQGILIGVIMGLGFSTAFLYRENRALQKEYTTALKDFSEKLIDLTKSYNDFVNIYSKNVRQ